MRFVSIALFILIFNLTLGVLTQYAWAGGPSLSINETLTNTTLNRLNQTLQQLNETTEAASTWEVMIWQFKLSILGPLEVIKGLGMATLATGQYLQQFVPIPDPVANIITTAVVLSYVLGLMEFLSGRRV